MAKSLADLKGLKMRVPQTKLYMDTFKALGTLPTPITFTELFTALQSGVVGDTSPRPPGRSDARRSGRGRRRILAVDGKRAG